jgi:hypothetical protein
MCEVPSFVFNASNAAKIINYNNVPLSQLVAFSRRRATMLVFKPRGCP